MLGPVTQQAINQILQEVKKEETQEKIKTSVLDPILGYLQARVFTYLQFMGILMAVIIILLVTIIYLVWRKRT